jgi:uncharacterized membrane protein YfcA
MSTTAINYLFQSTPFVVISFFTSIISATIGMAGGTALLSLMLFTLPASTAIPLHAAAQFMSNASRSWLLRIKVAKRLFLPFAAGSIIGNGVSFFLMLNTHWAQYFNLIISFIVLYSLFRPKQEKSFHLKQKGFFILGVVIGFLGLFVGATGLLLGPFILRKDLDKESTVATQAAMQTFNHALKIISFIFLGFIFTNYLPTLLGLWVGAILGTMVGVKILNRISAPFFFKLFRAVMFIAALKIFWDFFHKLGD